jgi:SAM-dependent methyltransferase
MSRARYDHFAAVYDQREHRIVAAAFHKRLRRLLKRVPPGAWVLDLGCGTGLLTKLLASDGFRVVGIDQSEEMLDIAAQRCRQFGSRVVLVHGDIRQAAKVARPGAALAVACGDVVNHLSSTSALGALFEAARVSLMPAGVLAFDALNAWCFRTYWHRRTYLYEGDAGDLLMQCAWNPRRRMGIARIVSYARRGANTCRKSETTLREYFYDNDEIRRTLRASGFTASAGRTWSPWPDQHLEARNDRTFWEAAVRESAHA